MPMPVRHGSAQVGGLNKPLRIEPSCSRTGRWVLQRSSEALLFAVRRWLASSTTTRAVKQRQQSDSNATIAFRSGLGVKERPAAALALGACDTRHRQSDSPDDCASIASDVLQARVQKR